MFTDEPPAFRPEPESMWPWVAAIVLAVAFGLYFYTDQVAKHNLAATRAANFRKPQPVANPTAPPIFENEVVSPTVVERPVVRALTATIYLCKGYSGGTFWSNAVCSSQRATIDRMTTVPADLSFDQQVAIASGQAQEAAQFYSAQSTGGPSGIGASSGPTHSMECASLIELTKDLDASALRPQDAVIQDRIRRQRMDVMSERAARHC
jgi:hypothetical protein